MDGAGAGVVGDEEGVDDLRGAGEEWVLGFEAGEVTAFEGGGGGGVKFEAGGGGEGFDAGFGEDEGVGAAVFVGEGAGEVVELGVKGDGKVGWKSPGSGGPDDEVGTGGGQA